MLMKITKRRQIGTTTKQILEAPRDAVYVWVNDVTGYPKYLAQKLGRTDLKVVPLSWLTGRSWQGFQKSVVVDHAVDKTAFTVRHYDAFYYLQARGLLS
jgi:hypothetical protein